MEAKEGWLGGNSRCSLNVRLTPVAQVSWTALLAGSIFEDILVDFDKTYSGGALSGVRIFYIL